MPITVTTSTELYEWLSELDGSNAVKLRWNPTITQKVDYAGSVLSVDRVYGLGMAGKQKQETWSLQFDVVPELDGDDEWAKLRYLVETRREQMIADGGRQAELLYRSCLGDTFRCVVKSFSRTPKKRLTAQVQLTLERVN